VGRREDSLQRRLAAERTAALLDVGDPLVVPLVEVALHRPHGEIAERAKRLALDPVADLPQQVEVVGLTVAALDLLEDLYQPARPLAAGRALPAGLVLVELGRP